MDESAIIGMTSLTGKERFFCHALYQRAENLSQGYGQTLDVLGIEY